MVFKIIGCDYAFHFFYYDFHWIRLFIFISKYINIDFLCKPDNFFSKKDTQCLSNQGSRPLLYQIF